jgi:hypothetical protein
MTVHDMKIKPLPTRSLLLAPLASIPASTLAGLGSSDAGITSDFLGGLVLSVMLAVPASYLGIVLIGLPLFMALRRFSLILLPVACAVGVAVPYALFHEANYRTTLMAVAAGLAVSITAFLLRPAELKSES